MDKMRELVQQSASSSTELSAAAEQMLKLSRNLLDSMDVLFWIVRRNLARAAKRLLRAAPPNRNERKSENMRNLRGPEALEIS